MLSIQRVGEISPARDDIGFSRVEQLEEFDQPGAHPAAIIPRGRLHQRDQPVERPGGILVQQLQIGRVECGLDVVGRLVGHLKRLGSVRGGARQELDLPDRLASTWSGSLLRIAP